MDWHCFYATDNIITKKAFLNDLIIKSIFRSISFLVVVGKNQNFF